MTRHGCFRGGFSNNLAGVMAHGVARGFARCKARGVVRSNLGVAYAA
jgi:hypothetical protein